MPFNADLPEWFAVGLEPNTSQKTTGYEPKVKPPAQWFNWHLNTSYLALKELQENAVHKEEIAARFDTTTRTTTTLNAGLQALTATKSALFTLQGVTGRMLVNLLGREGGCEAIGNWSSTVAITYDNTLRTSGLGSLKMTLSGASGAVSASFLTTPGKWYVAVADVRNSGTTKVEMSIRKGDNTVTATGSNVTSAATWEPVYCRFTATDFYHLVTLTATGSNITSYNIDSVRVYEVSSTDYTSMAGVAASQVAALLPFVNSVMSVRNPYAIRWTDATKTQIASMLALQTDLYADPVAKTNPDTVFERDGQYFKNKNWQAMTLDGNLGWVYKDTKTGNKQVTLPLTGQKTDSERIVKYDGKLIAHVYPWTDADQSFLAADGLYLSVPVADSGWGDSYTPTQDDIKAYFFGYKAYDANTITPANAQTMTTATWTGTGTKYWVQRVGAPNFTQSTPQQSYAGYTPYQLVYQLTTPVVEPIVSEGQLTFSEGDNQVEVGTGIVLREPVKPSLYPSATNRWMVNYIGAGGINNPLKNAPSKVLNVYGNNVSEAFNWGVTTTSGTWYGNVYIDQLYTYAPDKSYSVSYLMLEPSPVVPFTGSYAANEKTLLADLVDSVQQADTRVSVLESKKAEKDNPAWITPTLLNSWVSMGVLGYRKKDNTVQVKARIKSGVIGQPFMILPSGFRPLVGQVRPVQTYSTTDVFGAVLLNADGKCIVSGGSNNEVNIYLEFTTD
jgi:hypothetical protein